MDVLWILCGHTVDLGWMDIWMYGRVDGCKMDIEWIETMDFGWILNGSWMDGWMEVYVKFKKIVKL